jgi:hypothetical protein
VASLITGAKQEVKSQTIQRSSGCAEARGREAKGKKPTASLFRPACFNRVPRFGPFFVGAGAKLGRIKLSVRAKTAVKLQSRIKEAR